MPGSNPPVCKIINFGKFRYDQTKREKESKKSQHQVKVKEIKLKPNIDDHDFETKIRHAREFIAKGNKVKVHVLSWREMAHPEIGETWYRRSAMISKMWRRSESPVKMFGRMLTVVLAPEAKRKKSTSHKPELKVNKTAGISRKSKETRRIASSYKFRRITVPKMKTKKAVVARFKLTATGKLKRAQPDTGII